MEDGRPSATLKVLAAMMFLFLLAPVIIVVPISLNDDPFMAFPPARWSLRWYRAIFSDPQMVDAFWTSLVLAASVAVLSFVAGLAAAFALVRLKPPGAALLANLFTAPLLLPSIVLALAILIVLAPLGLLSTYRGLLLAHMVVTLPYAVRVLSTSLATMPPLIEEAAATLGAPPLKVFSRITFPMLMPGISGTLALCFLISFDEVVLSLFLTGPRLTTLPVQMFHHVENQADPLIAAISVLLVALTLAVVLIVDRTAGLARTFIK